MQEKESLSEQDDSLQEQRNEEIRIGMDGGRIEGTEGGMRADIFDHDFNSEYDFSEYDCPICELPENAQDIIIQDIEQEELNA
jgi:hypothetical protein